MGVPVIAMPGCVVTVRHTTSHLHNAGLDEFIAQTPTDYKAKAVEFASDLPKLASLRASMRGNVTFPFCTLRCSIIHSTARRCIPTDVAKLVRTTEEELFWMDKVTLLASDCLEVLGKIRARLRYFKSLWARHYSFMP